MKFELLSSFVSRFASIAGAAAMVVAASATAGAEVYIYPEKGQSQEQQDKDKYECNRWAIEQSGFDPARQSSAPKTSGAVGGAARGAALGAIGGAIAGDAGKGAAIGAATGGAMGGMRRRRVENEHERAQEAGRAEYGKAFGACMSRRGYSVK